MTNKDKTYEDNLAATFLYKYFTSLIKSPESLKNFYLPNSIISRRYGNEASYRVVGYESLKDSKSKFAAVNLSSIDSQQTNSSGVFISCTGITYNEDNQSRSFHQSFLLEKVDSSYYITNDIFVLSQHTESEQPLPDEASNSHSVELEPHLNGANEHKEEEKEEQLVPIEPTKPVSETVNDKQEPIEKHIEEVKPTTVQQPTQQINKKETKQQQTTPPTSTATISGAKPSLADLIKTTTPTTNIPSTNNTTTTTTSPTTTTTTTTNSQTATSSVSSSSATTQVAVTKDHSQAAFTRDGCTIYYSNFKSTIKLESPQIRESLQQYGTIQNIKTFNCYGFVEYEKLESVQRLLTHVSTNNNKMTIGGCEVNIEERKGGPPQKSSNFKQFKDKKPSNNTNNNNNNNTNTNTNNNNNKFQTNNTNIKTRDNNQNNRKPQNNDKKI